MNEKITRLVESRDADWASAKTILEAANAARRELTREERSEYDRLSVAIDTKAVEIRTLEHGQTMRSFGGSMELDSRGRPMVAPGSPVEYRAGKWLHSELERRGIVEGSGAGAAFTPYEASATFFDVLTVLLASGVNQIRTSRESLRIPRVTSEITSGFLSEGDAITRTDLDGDDVVATPRKLGALQVVSNETLSDSIPSILDVIARSIIRSMSLSFDLASFEGSGTAPSIRGLKNISGIQTVSMGTHGAALTNLDPFAQAIGDIEAANAHASAIVMHPRAWTQLSQVKSLASGSNKPLLQNQSGSGSQGIERSLYGVPVFLSSQLSTTETQGTATSIATSAYVYDASQLFVVTNESPVLEVNRYRLFNTDQSELRGLMRADLIAAHAPAVCRIEGILA